MSRRYRSKRGSYQSSNNEDNDSIILDKPVRRSRRLQHLKEMEQCNQSSTSYQKYEK